MASMEVTVEVSIPMLKDTKDPRTQTVTHFQWSCMRTRAAHCGCPWQVGKTIAAEGHRADEHNLQKIPGESHQRSLCTMLYAAMDGASERTPPAS